MDRKRYVLAGTGSRGLQMFGKPLLTEFPGRAELVGLFDHNPSRLKAANHVLGSELPGFTDFDAMLSKLNPDGIIVTTRDDTHSEFVLRGLHAGKRVYAEKPLCTTAEQCREISTAASSAKGIGFVTHNMRYNPAITLIKELVSSGKIGRMLSMEFRENLDRVHGSAYFHRWHRFKANSGGLLIHKASHHFDCLNWLNGSTPESLIATGGTLVYGKAGPFRHTSCRDCPHAGKCEFHFDLSAHELPRKLYMESEKHDGYLRDACVFDERIDIEDHAAVYLNYQNGVRLTYTLSAFASYEGIFMALEGTEGRLEFQTFKARSFENDKHAFEQDTFRPRLTYFRQSCAPEDIPVPARKGGHGGSDELLREDFFARPWDAPRPERMASLDEAIQAVAIGAAANESIARGGQKIHIQEFLTTDAK